MCSGLDAIRNPRVTTRRCGVVRRLGLPEVGHRVVDQRVHVVRGTRCAIVWVSATTLHEIEAEFICSHGQVRVQTTYSPVIAVTFDRP